MDENEKNIVSFDRPIEEPEPEPVKTVEIDYPRETEYPKAVIDEPAHAAPTGPSHSKPKEKKYVTKGALIACMILTMILSSLLGAFISGAYFSKTSSDGRAQRNDSELSQLDLGDATGSDLTVSQIVDKNENAVVEILMSGTQQNMWGQMQLVQGVVFLVFVAVFADRQSLQVIK